MLGRSGLSPGFGARLGSEHLEVEFLIDLGELPTRRHGEQLVGHGGEDAQVSGGVFGEGGHHLWRHETWMSGLDEGMLEPIEEILGLDR